MVPVRKSPWGSLRLDSHADVQQLVMDLTDADRAYLAANPDTPCLYDTAVRYRADGPGEQDWLIIPEVLASGTADCKSLAAWRAAESGGVPIVIRTRRGNYHVVVRMPDGTYEDPSRKLGMKGGRSVGLLVGYVETRRGVHGVAVGRVDGRRAIRARCFVPYTRVQHVGGPFDFVVRAAKNVAKNSTFKAIAGTALDIAAGAVPGGALAKGALDLAGRAIAGAKETAPPATSTAPAPTRRAPPAGAPAAESPATARLKYLGGRGYARPGVWPTNRRTLRRSGRASAEFLREAKSLIRRLPPHEQVPVIKKLLGDYTVETAVPTSMRV